MDNHDLLEEPSMRHDDTSPARPERAPVANDGSDDRDKLAKVVIAALLIVAVLAATNITGAVLATVLIPIVNAINKR